MARRVVKSRTLASAWLVPLRRLEAESRTNTYPLTKYQDRPLDFVREVLHVAVVMPHQAAMLRALSDAVSGRATKRVAARSGQKSGKTATAIWAALWFYSCFPEARVFICAAIVEQTKRVLWHELRQALRKAKEGGFEIEGELANSPAGGFRSPDGSRTIEGIAGREIESIAGISGRQLTIVDEASHLPEEKAQAFEGNALGGAGFLFFISNPTTNAGPFYEAFHAQKEFWQTFHIDGEEVARWQNAEGVRIPNIITLEGIEEARERYKEDSQFWCWRVKGEFLKREEGRCIPMYIIEAAIARWYEAPDEGALQIGYDCAGPGDAGDQHAWAVVRGKKCLAIIRARGLDEGQALAKTFAVIDVYAKPGEVPKLVVDSDGPIGSSLYGRFRGEAEHRLLHGGQPFEVRGVKASSRYVRDPSRFERTKDELCWNLAQWLHEGAIPNDPELQVELYSPEWTSLPGGQLKTTPKSAIRDLLNRSPDSFDALALATWNPIAQVIGLAQASPKLDVYDVVRDERQVFDPYGAERAFRT